MRGPSLQARVVLVVLLAYVVLGGLSLAFFVGLAHRWVAAYGARYAGRDVLLQRSRVNALIGPEVRLARKMADDPAVLRFVADEQYEPAAMEALRSYSRAFRDHGWFLAIDRSLRYYVFDPGAARGEGTVHLTRLQPGDPASRWYFEARETREPYLVNLDFQPAIHATKVWINVPLRDRDGHTLGMAGGGVDVSDLVSSITSGADGIDTILVDRAGAVQARSDGRDLEPGARAAAGERITLATLLGTADAARLRSAMDGLRAGASEVETLELRAHGSRRLAAVAYMPELGWFDVVLLDTGRVASVASFLPLLAVVAAGVAVLLLVLLAVLDRGLLQRLKVLTAAARAVSGGDYRVRVQIEGGDEVSLLAQTFNAMVGQVDETTGTLEQKVLERTARLSEANARLETSQRSILESLRYARAIQAAVLPPAAEVEAALGPALVLYRPCELVGGDFYWLRRLDAPGGFLLAVVDCTGHGVPGAFMSLMASSALSHVVDGGEAAPAQVLARLDRTLVERVHAPGAGHGLDAGLDIALLRCAPGGPLCFAGAGLSLWVVEGGRVRELRGARQRIGYRRAGPAQPYDVHALELPRGSRVYLASDGLIDQPGGPRGFGYGRARFAELLGSLAAVPLADQAPPIEAALQAWAGAHRQRDDVTVIGFEVQTEEDRDGHGAAEPSA